MKLRWSVLAVITAFPLGAALADYTDTQATAAPLPQAQRTVEHESFLESAKQSVDHATQTAHEIAVALENARRNQDMLLVTCLSDALENVRKAQGDAIKTLAAMTATRTEADARALGPDIMRTNQALLSGMQNATRCQSSDDKEGAGLLLDPEVESTLDPGGAASAPASDLPPGTLPPSTLPTVDVMEPGTDMPMMPPTASPMR